MDIINKKGDIYITDATTLTNGCVDNRDSVFLVSQMKDEPLADCLNRAAQILMEASRQVEQYAQAQIAKDVLEVTCAEQTTETDHIQIFGQEME